MARCFKSLGISVLILLIVASSGCTDYSIQEKEMEANITRLCQENGFDDGCYTASGFVLMPNYACCHKLNGSLVVESYRVFGDESGYRIYKDRPCKGVCI